MAKDKATEPTTAAPATPTSPATTTSVKKRTPDAEFQALARIDRILTELEPTAALRVMDMLYGRVKSKALATAPPINSQGQSPV